TPGLGPWTSFATHHSVRIACFDPLQSGTSFDHLTGGPWAGRLAHPRLPLHSKDGIEWRGSFHPHHLGEPDLPEQRFVLRASPLLTFGAGQHVQILHLSPARPALVVVE